MVELLAEEGVGAVHAGGSGTGEDGLGSWSRADGDRSGLTDDDGLAFGAGPAYLVMTEEHRVLTTLSYTPNLPADCRMHLLLAAANRWPEPTWWSSIWRAL